MAKAVHFLHTGIIPGFFSNRLKMNNILLNENDNAKLSDYGLSIISEETDKSMVGLPLKNCNFYFYFRCAYDIYLFLVCVL